MENINLYTHKKNKSEIFLKNTSRLSNNHFQATFKLVPEHHFYSDFLACANGINPLFLLECARQVETYLSHTEFGIKLGNKFLLNNWSLTCYPSKAVVTEDLISDIHTKYPITNKTIKNEFNFSFKLQDIVIGTVIIGVRYITNHCYKLIRKTPVETTNSSIAIPLSPKCVCYTKLDNVILADLNDNGPYINARIKIDENNKSLNDHEQDHITGLNITESAKQICYCYLSIYMHEETEQFILVSMEAHFMCYVEKLIPAIVSIKKITFQNNTYSFDIDITQNKKTLATVSLVLRGEYE
ncbi:hypothetical protein GQY78_000045 [Escherichia coli]|uniref:AfsA-related hotdog domain-containing protein n=1 Tax=Klebsiella sp. RHBSTW-00465 TaxID=2742650 RepID=UPI0015F42C89|nr:AfsA-related hotdog domain-containing protein [Klebsiella sp. RHBSTW-00465]EEQ3637105.1 hypothetical protein [Escherichia coli]MBA7847836.1 hypothetical protein [Klebsiella sp. RHBSTW-00465]HEM8644048.1 hypothetical protein [Klebsiella aerogenes]